jgi:hypothetical protein
MDKIDPFQKALRFLTYFHQTGKEDLAVKLV